MGSKLMYLACGYGIFVIIGRMLGPSDLGVFGIVFTALNIVFIFLRNGVPQAASTFIGGDPHKARAISQKAIKLNLFFGAFLFGIFFLGSDSIAADILKDKRLCSSLRLASLSIIPVALYNGFSGTLLGARYYRKEAIGATLTSICRIIFSFFFILIGCSINGVIVAYALAAVAGTGFLSLFCKFGKSTYQAPTKSMILFAIPLIMSGGIITLLLNIDSIFVKRITGSDELVGFYFAAASASHALYHIFSAFGVTLLPSIAGSCEKGNTELTRKYANQAIRYSMMLAIPFVSMVCGSSEELMQLLYGSPFVASSKPFACLMLATLFLVLAYNANMCIAAVGKPWVCILFYGLGTAMAASLLSFLVPKYGIIGGGIAMVLACFLCLLLSLFYVEYRINRTIRWVSVFRILSSALPIYFMILYFPVHGLLLLPWYLFSFIIYGLLMWGLGEWTSEDAEVIKGILSQHKSGA